MTSKISICPSSKQTLWVFIQEKKQTLWYLGKKKHISKLNTFSLSLFFNPFLVPHSSKHVKTKKEAFSFSFLFPLSPLFFSLPLIYITKHTVKILLTWLLLLYLVAAATIYQRSKSSTDVSTYGKAKTVDRACSGRRHRIRHTDSATSEILNPIQVRF